MSELTERQRAALKGIRDYAKNIEWEIRSDNKEDANFALDILVEEFAADLRKAINEEMK